MQVRIFVAVAALFSSTFAFAHGDHAAGEQLQEHPEHSITLPFDPMFCDLNGNGKVDKEEIRMDNLCNQQLEGDHLFSQRPIAALGLAKGQLVLSTDDGPNPAITPKILDLLDQYGIKSHFFVVGKLAQAHPELIREIVRRGHTVGNHTYTHPVKISAQALLPEVLKAHQVLTSALGGQIPGRLLFRAPGLAWSAPKALTLNDNSITRNYIGPIHANIGADAPRADWYCWSHHISVEDCASFYFDQIVNTGRGIILSHDIVSNPERNSYEMLKLLLHRLDTEAGGIKNKNGQGVWEFVSLQNLPVLDQFETNGAAPAKLPVDQRTAAPRN